MYLLYVCMRMGRDMSGLGFQVGSCQVGTPPQYKAGNKVMGPYSKSVQTTFKGNRPITNERFRS